MKSFTNREYNKMRACTSRNDPTALTSMIRRSKFKRLQLVEREEWRPNDVLLFAHTICSLISSQTTSTRCHHDWIFEFLAGVWAGSVVQTDIFTKRHLTTAVSSVCNNATIVEPSLDASFYDILIIQGSFLSVSHGITLMLSKFIIRHSNTSSLL